MGPLVTMSKARFPIYAISDLLTVDSLTADQQTLLANAIAAPSYIFVAHADGSEVFTGVNARLQTFAQQHGYRKALPRSVHDRHGRPMFEVFRFQAKRLHVELAKGCVGRLDQLLQVRQYPAVDVRAFRHRHLRFARIEPVLRKSITFDNDTAFAQHALLRPCAP